MEKSVKKIVAFALALTLALSLSVPAFAVVTVDGESQGLIKEVWVDKAQCVSANAKGDDLTVAGDVTGDSQRSAISVIAQNGAEITVRGEVTAELDWPGSAIQAFNDSTKVTVEGAVTEKTNGNAINAFLGAAVEAGSVDEKKDGDAINASSGASVTVKGAVTEEGGGNAIYATGSGTKVTVKESVTECDDGDAIYAQKGATVIVYGNVEENGEGGAINTGKEGDVTVIVGGDVTETAGEGQEGKYIAVLVNGENTTVIIEGTVDVDGYVGATNSGELYLGKLERAGKGIGDTDNIHYLIGVAPEGSAALSAVTLVSDIVAPGTIDGVNEKGYRYTKTADATALNGNTITLKPADGKILTVSNHDIEGVTYTENKDGSVTLKIDKDFKGGLQDLVLVLTDKPDPTPGSNHKPNAVYYTVRVSTAAVDTKVAEDNDAAAEEMPVLGLGDSGDAVVILQTALNAQGFDCGEVDGIFGQNTLNAVKAFQTAKGLTVDGIVGAQTWEALL